VLVLLASVASALAQRRGGFGGGGGFGGRNRREAIVPNTPYDGRFTFVRVRYGPDYGFASQGLPWSHDYPSGEQHFMKIVNELSNLNPHTDETNILTFDDPELFKYPVAYLCEPGRWVMTDEEAVSLRTYLQKGGFVIVDDFKSRGFRGGGGWDIFEQNMKRVLPGGRFVDLTAAHPIFHSFFEIDSLDIIPQAYIAGRPIFRGLYEDNDPTKRLQMIVNFNTDVSQFWEWSGRGLRSIDDTNEAYKLGVNYIVYGLTH
jgi:hypothetical protein